MLEESRKYGRVDFDTSVQLMILEPYSKIVYMKDASNTGLKIVSDLDIDLLSELQLKNMELEHSIPFNAKVMWKKSLEDGLFYYGLEIIS